jgi:hypothetical protein
MQIELTGRSPYVIAIYNILTYRITGQAVKEKILELVYLADH